MTQSQSQEVTIEEIGDDSLDLGPYQLVRWEAQGRFIVLVVKEKPRSQARTSD